MYVIRLYTNIYRRIDLVYGIRLFGLGGQFKMNKISQTTQTECYITVALVHCTFDGLMVKYNQILVL